MTQRVLRGKHDPEGVEGQASITQRVSGSYPSHKGVTPRGSFNTFITPAQAAACEDQEMQQDTGYV